MPKFFPLLLIAALGIGGYFFFTHYRLKGLENFKIEPLNGAAAPANKSGPAPPVATGDRKTIRIASANMGPLDREKLSQRDVAAHLVEIIRRFDVIAIQGVWGHNQEIVLDLLERVNQGGRNWDFAVSDRVGREPVEKYSAFFFDRSILEIDRSTVFEVSDPGQVFLNKPLVAAFRVRGPDADEAFTFTLVNVEIDPAQAELELNLLADVFRAVRDDGRGEDDVLLVGTFGIGPEQLAALHRIPRLIWSIADRPTTTLGSGVIDNILFDSRATVEFAGRAGIMDLMNDLDIPVRQATQVSEHLPVWAEFSVFEGGQVGRIAGAPGPSPR
ncbi:MAG: exonuclease/endonuclease/phosphatase family protein [Thermoguttaceae bacterium]